VVAASIVVTSIVCAILCVIMMIGSQQIVSHHDTMEVTFLKFVDDFESKATAATLDLLALVIRFCHRSSIVNSLRLLSDDDDDDR
jgi:hypothetical protein